MTAKIDDIGSDSKKSLEKRGSRRFIILLVSFFFLSFIHAGFLSYNCGYVAMSELITSPLYNEETFSVNRSMIPWNADHLSLSDRRFDFTPEEKGWSFAAGFAGAMFGVPILGLMTAKWGMHRMMSGMGAMIAVTCFLLPYLVSISFPLFLFLRFLSGTALAILFAAAGHVVSYWAPLNERGLWIAVLSGHVEFSPFFSMPHAGLVGSEISWPAIYYSHGVIALLVTILWIFVHKDDPRDVKWLKKEELDRVMQGKFELLNAKREKQKPVSFLKLIKTPVVVGIWVACIGYYFGVQFSITFSLLYYSSALHYSPIVCGFVTMIPLLILLFLKLVTGHISDRLTSIREVTRMRIFNSIALIGSAFFFLIASFRQPDGSWMDVAVVVCILGCHSGGYPKCAVIVARKHSAAVFSYMQLFGCGSLVAGAFMVPMLTPSGEHAEWGIVFRAYAVVMLVCNLVFCYTATDKPCEWALEKETTEVEISTSENQTHKV
ncbi:unnamed protein product, partial [Mesorhabditis belari]|uniref:Major facilitator superfamily (MFS) profile domain-containing protein n=1 Tax=Mesorhabditis belari TaxID=2138241 RepID=A0AAF3J321_9BILA